MLKKLNPDKFLLRILSLNSIGIVIRLLAGFVLNKIIAVYVGPAGLGSIGNLRSFMQSLESISSLGFKNAIVKYTATSEKDKSKLTTILSTTFFVGFLGSLLSAIILFTFSEFWSNYVFKSLDYINVIRVAALSIFFVSTNIYLLALLNGLEKHKTYIKVNIVSSLLGLLINLGLFYKFNIEGIIYGIVIIPGIALSITLYALKKEKLLFLRLKIHLVDFSYLKLFFEYSLMAILSAFLVHPTLILIRNYITETIDSTAMGYWEAMYRVSSYNMLFISSLLGLYWLPKLSKIVDTRSFREEVFTLYKTLLPLVAIGLLVAYFSRNLIITILFSSDFKPISSLFCWQLLGDFFRIASTVLATQFVAQKQTKSYLFTEILSVIIWYTTSVFFIDKYGFLGASMGYFLCYSLYFIILIFWFRKLLFFK